MRRIIRGNDDNNPDDNNNHDHDHDHGKNQRSASEADAARMAEALVDEAEEFLAGLAAANPHEPAPEPKPVARLVKSLTSEQAPPVPVEDENLIPALRPQPDQTPVQAGRRMPKWARTALPGSLFVVALGAGITYSQPAVVAVPIDIYAGAWVGFLFWNAAHRPPLRDVTAAMFSGLIGLLSVLAQGIRALVTGIGARWGRLETAPTTH
ncbi:hypothetical protein ACIO14_15195 [Nocardia fluminea]|uniref:hypothetical protein n=1 Tax=Nocardia fluminea TaxID=134984 RepID=UPI0037FDB986